MLSAIVSGTLATDPKAGTSKSGVEWSNAVIRCPCGQNRETGEQEAAFVQVACFGNEASKLARLSKGDTVSASGALKPSVYTSKTGEERHGLSLAATGILSAYVIRKKAGATDTAPKPAPHAGRGHHGADYDDAIGF
jgi:single-stranded DNA-binding protein